MMPASDSCFGIALNREQGALVMHALAARPFRSVYQLIGRLNTWGAQSFDGGGALQARRQPFTLTGAELELVMDALGELPHRRVHVLLASLQRQLDQLQQPGPRASHG